MRSQIRDLRSQIFVLLTALIGLALVFWAAANSGHGRADRMAVGALVGFAGGVALYHAAFGFTGAWRALQREGRGAGVRAQLLMLALIIVVSYPLIAYGREVGVAANGWVNAMSLSSAIGAFVFGVGMQLAGGCGSGTLFTAGGGSTRMAIALVAFIAGSVIWTGTVAEFQAGLAAMERAVGFEDRARIGAVSLISELGPIGALGVVFAILAALYVGVVRIERARRGAIEPLAREGSLLKGPWSLWFAAALLAAVVIATFLTLGRPWGITGAFPLWGAKALYAVGYPIEEWRAWSVDRLEQSLFTHATGVMNFGVMLGALAAAGAAGRFAPQMRLSARDAATAVIGGLLMGYGARLAGGCNIGGFVGGVASGSLHGWWWLAFGVLGSVVGVLLRARLGMDPPIAPRPAVQT